MKRTVALTAGVLAIGAAVYVVGQLWAGPPAKPAGAPQTRVAIINIPYVVQNYTKYKDILKQMEAENKKYVEQIKKIQERKDTLAKQVPSADPAKKEELESKIKDLKRDMQDAIDEAKKAMLKRDEEALVEIYKDIRAAAWRYGRAHNFDLVLHYEEAANEKDFYKPALIHKKLHSSGCVPVYWDPALDISQNLLSALNQAYKNPAPKAPGK